MNVTKGQKAETADLYKSEYDTLTEAVEIIEGIQNGYSGNAGCACGGEQAVYEAAELTAF
ncbi:MAG: hypothetical protein ACLR5P_05240 [[Eubacterium] siraeum]